MTEERRKELEEFRKLPKGKFKLVKDENRTGYSLPKKIFNNYATNFGEWTIDSISVPGHDGLKEIKRDGKLLVLSWYDQKKLLVNGKPCAFTDSRFNADMDGFSFFNLCWFSRQFKSFKAAYRYVKRLNLPKGAVVDISNNYLLRLNGNYYNLSYTYIEKRDNTFFTTDFKVDAKPFTSMLPNEPKYKKANEYIKFFRDNGFFVSIDKDKNYKHQEVIIPEDELEIFGFSVFGNDKYIFFSFNKSKNYLGDLEEGNTNNNSFIYMQTYEYFDSISRSYRLPINTDINVLLEISKLNDADFEVEMEKYK